MEYYCITGSTAKGNCVASTTNITCYKYATIEMETNMIPIQTYLEKFNKPAFVVQDILKENIINYKCFGYFLTHILLKSKYHFQCGISDWWQKHLYWAIKSQAMTRNKRYNESEVEYFVKVKQCFEFYVPCMIPLFGFVVSTVAYILFEIKALKYVLTRFRRVFKFQKKNVATNVDTETNQNQKCFQPEDLDFPDVVQKHCRFCRSQGNNINIEDAFDLELHMANLDTVEFLDTVNKSCIGNIGFPSYLSNLVLNLVSTGLTDKIGERIQYLAHLH